MVGLQQSAQAIDTDDLAVVSSVPRFDDFVDALMNALVMVVCENRPCIAIAGLAKVIGTQKTVLLAGRKRGTLTGQRLADWRLNSG